MGGMTEEYETVYQAQSSTDPMTSPRHEADGIFNDHRAGSPSQAGRNADAMDLAGVGEAKLECTVTQPLKENDGSKDAYMSYLVTTIVCASLSPKVFC
jgi:sorting nexin-4